MHPPPQHRYNSQRAPDRVPAVVRWWRWARFWRMLALHFAMVGAVFPRVGASRRNRLTGWWARKLLRIMGIVLSPHGGAAGPMQKPDHRVQSCVLGGHFVISAAHPALFIAKSEIRDWPIAGFICERAGTIFIRRARRRDTAVINETMHKVLSDGYTVGSFRKARRPRGQAAQISHVVVRTGRGE